MKEQKVEFKEGTKEAVRQYCNQIQLITDQLNTYKSALNTLCVATLKDNGADPTIEWKFSEDLTCLIPK